MEERPYIHSPEEGSEEAEQQVWRIHIPLGGEASEADPDPEPPDAHA
jgi:hypothetical protein